MVSSTSRSVSFKVAMGGGDMTLCGNYVMVSHLGFQYFPETLNATKIYQKKIKPTEEYTAIYRYKSYPIMKLRLFSLK